MLATSNLVRKCFVSENIPLTQKNQRFLAKIIPLLKEIV